MHNVVEAKNLTKSFPSLRGDQEAERESTEILKGIDLTIARGEFVSVMGPSGSGKSTLLYNLSGMDRFSSGSVSILGREIAGLSEKELAAIRLTDMGFIFQQIHLLKDLNLLDNILLSGYLHGKLSRRDVRRRAEELMDRTGIASLAKHTITQASGGQLQRVGICRALINEPAVLFGDEPTGALDSKSAGEIMELIRGIHAEGTTVMLVTHDPKVASMSERVVFMLDGRIAAERSLGRFSGDGEEAQAREREAELSAWLIGLSN